MNPEFTHLHQLLRQRLDTIADHAFRDRDPAAHLAELQRVSEALSAEHQRLKPVLPARLNHFLTQSSLTKALEYIEEASV
ncbi:hypothetical protein EI77_04148 [Prosthecobacter fusiformis]|uniref:Uncharacterized protein n=1 Tax=Prosthecobacter fusiformis TaxID=48464 RepID=A0A4R7RL33_9BACT|nr:hypothetical protein [Prosthecobacter fusiformis]TDU64262.1 hypothetical protein EI77_04148 [Prosthecobacter fusiformis]